MSRPSHRVGALRPEPPPAPPSAPPLLIDSWIGTRHVVFVNTATQEAWTASDLPVSRKIRAAVNEFHEPGPHRKCDCVKNEIWCECEFPIFRTWVAFVINEGKHFVYSSRTIHLGEPPDFVDAAYRRAIESDPC